MTTAIPGAKERLPHIDQYSSFEHLSTLHGALHTAYLFLSVLKQYRRISRRISEGMVMRLGGPSLSEAAGRLLMSEFVAMTNTVVKSSSQDDPDGLAMLLS